MTTVTKQHETAARDAVGVAAASACAQTTSPRRALRRRGQPGVTLLEVLVASSVLSMIALMIFAAFDNTSKVRTRLGDRQERDHVARVALAKMSRDLRSAFLSAHVNITTTVPVSVVTSFVGRDQSPGDRLDMTTFTHQRMVRGAHEGDACEVGYRVEARRGPVQAYDLLRRESARIDNDPLRGGTLDVLVPDIVSFNARYYDQISDQWVDGWDTTQSTGQPGRLPPRVRLAIVLRDGSNTERRYATETQMMIQDVLRFGLPIDYR